MAIGERTPLALLDAAASGRMAVCEAVTNIAAADIARLEDIRLSANWMAACGEPGEDADLFDTVRAVGMEICPELGIAIPVGKDSLSMKTAWREGDEARKVVAPVSLIVSAFAPVVDVRRTLTPQLRTDCGDTRLVLVDLGGGRDRLGGSCLAQVYGRIGREAPDCDDPGRMRGFFDAIVRLRGEGLLLAYHDRSDGGLFVTLAEMAFAGRCGVEAELGSPERRRRWPRCLLRNSAPCCRCASPTRRVSCRCCRRPVSVSSPGRSAGSCRTTGWSFATPAAKSLPQRAPSCAARGRRPAT
jgi:phosphoribosylformylglycinamidine synthase